MKTEVYEIRTLSGFVVCQYVDYKLLERHLKNLLSHLTSYQIVKITKEEEIICEVERKAEARAHGESIQQVSADSSTD